MRWGSACPNNGGDGRGGLRLLERSACRAASCAAAGMPSGRGAAACRGMLLLVCPAPTPPHPPCTPLCPRRPPGLLIFADWYHEESIKKLRFFDDNTRSWWDAATGEALVGSVRAGLRCCMVVAPLGPPVARLPPAA